MNNLFVPLAARMRPTSLDQFYGQSHLLAPGKPLRQAIELGHLHSMILWGPPGTGKTTLASLIAKTANAHTEQISAVLAGVKDIRQAVEKAQSLKQPTILFVDEVHRFNKAQQDAFLPFVEDGTLTLIGATTENPSFELNSALLSRARVYVLKSLTEEDLLKVLQRALQEDLKREISLEFLTLIVQASDGDARRALSFLEMIVDLALDKVTEEIVAEVIKGGAARFDKKGEQFYDQISALHKSVRGSDPDAALYWFCRMIAGGTDPVYIARRMVRMASEDIGNADPRALQLALNAWDTYERLGSPEGELTLAQVVIYLACAPKSNATYNAFKAAKEQVEKQGTLSVPLHLRNAPTKLMKNLGYGKAYRYAHDEPEGYAVGENYFPEEMPKTQYYFPVDRGLEIKIKEKLEYLKKLEQQHR